MQLEFTSEEKMEEAVVEHLNMVINMLRYANTKRRDLQTLPVYLLSESEVFNQVDLGSYGVADIVVITKRKKKKLIHVIELKNRELKMKDLEQLSRHIKGLDEICELMCIENVKITGSIVCLDCGQLFYNYYLPKEIEYYSISLDTLSGILFYRESFSLYKKTESPDIDKLLICKQLKELIITTEDV